MLRHACVRAIHCACRYPHHVKIELRQGGSLVKLLTTGLEDLGAFAWNRTFSYSGEPSRACPCAVRVYGVRACFMSRLCGWLCPLPSPRFLHCAF